MKLLVISNENNYETTRLLKECEKQKLAREFVHPMKFKHGFQATDFTHVLIRQIRGHAKTAKEFTKVFLDEGKIIVDEKIALGKDSNKLQNYRAFNKAGLFVPYTYRINERTLKKVKQFRNRFVVIKPLKGKRGESLFRVKKSEVREFVKNMKEPERYLMQEFVPMKKELRVLVVGNKVLGAIEKETDNWIHNFSMGAIPKKHKLTKKVIDVSLKACNCVETEIGGVDVGFKKKGGYFVIEVNRSPGFEFFEKTTKKNIAKEILNYVKGKTKACLVEKQEKSLGFS